MNRNKLTDDQATLKELRQESHNLGKQLIEIDAKLANLESAKSSKQK